MSEYCQTGHEWHCEADRTDITCRKCPAFMHRGTVLDRMLAAESALAEANETLRAHPAPWALVHAKAEAKTAGEMAKSFYRAMVAHMLEADRLRKALSGLVETWGEHWDCSASPGHAAMEPALETAMLALNSLPQTKSDPRVPLIEVRRIGDDPFAQARLFVNAHGVASWPWSEEVNRTHETGEHYANEVARCLRVALGVRPDGTPKRNVPGARRVFVCEDCGAMVQSEPIPAPPALPIFPMPAGWTLRVTPPGYDDEPLCRACSASTSQTETT